MSEGWYGPPNSRKFHWIGADGKSLCGKWFVIAWCDDLIDRAYGPANGDCVVCKRKHEAATVPAASSDSETTP